jgi:hypothetical protein
MTSCSLICLLKKKKNGGKLQKVFILPEFTKNFRNLHFFVPCGKISANVKHNICFLKSKFQSVFNCIFDNKILMLDEHKKQNTISY